MSGSNMLKRVENEVELLKTLKTERDALLQSVSRINKVISELVGDATQSFKGEETKKKGWPTGDTSKKTLQLVQSTQNKLGRGASFDELLQIYKSSDGEIEASTLRARLYYLKKNKGWITLRSGRYSVAKKITVN